MTDSDRKTLVETANDVRWIRETMAKQDSRLDQHSKQIGWIKRYIYMAVGAVGLLEFFRMRG